MMMWLTFCRPSAKPSCGPTNEMKRRTANDKARNARCIVKPPQRPREETFLVHTKYIRTMSEENDSWVNIRLKLRRGIRCETKTNGDPTYESNPQAIFACLTYLVAAVACSRSTSFRRAALPRKPRK